MALGSATPLQANRRGTAAVLISTPQLVGLKSNLSQKILEEVAEVGVDKTPNNFV